MCSKVLITGGSGYLGAALVRYIHTKFPHWESHFTFFSNPSANSLTTPHQLDLRSNLAIEQLVGTVNPQIIIHTAALNRGNVVGAPWDEDIMRVNADASAFLARLAALIRARFMYISTDVIFDGRRGNYCEQDTPNPLTQYGASKYAGERSVLASGANAIVARTSLIYGFAPPDPRTRDLLNGTMPRLFTDERRCPVWVENLCAVLIELAESSFQGILNVAGTQFLNRYEFGTKLVRALGGDTNSLIATTTSAEGIARPLDCTLDCSLAGKILKTKLLGVDQVLHGFSHSSNESESTQADN